MLLYSAVSDVPCNDLKNNQGFITIVGSLCCWPVSSSGWALQRRDVESPWALLNFLSHVTLDLHSAFPTSTIMWMVLGASCALLDRIVSKWSRATWKWHTSKWERKSKLWHSQESQGTILIKGMGLKYWCRKNRGNTYLWKLQRENKPMKFCLSRQ